MRGFRENFFQKSPSLCRSLKGAIQQKSHLCYPAVKESLANRIPSSIATFRQCLFYRNRPRDDNGLGLEHIHKNMGRIPESSKENRPLEI
jgi:hypothetical protein